MGNKCSLSYFDIFKYSSFDCGKFNFKIIDIPYEHDNVKPHKPNRKPFGFCKIIKEYKTGNILEYESAFYSDIVLEGLIKIILVGHTFPMWEFYIYTTLDNNKFYMLKEYNNDGINTYKPIPQKKNKCKQ